MSDHRIFRQTSEVIATVLEDGVKDVVGRSIQVVTGPPMREKFTRLPALGVYLYRVWIRPRRREDSRTRIATINAAGEIEEFYQDPALRVSLDYLITAWADEDAEQQELLGAAMYTLLGHPSLEGDVLEGDAFDPEERIPLSPVEDLSVEFLMSLWRGFGEHLRAAAGYTCRLRLASPRRSGSLRRVEERRIDIQKAGR